ncbi:MAG: hypothetical protein A2X18_08820 [Bacteroidetes bacterium GWF2_40_14]|nr:MAG: hypothetical protein A2X18_08820 [Bacteroidetes bacterium GWF2_40_14]
MKHIRIFVLSFLCITYASQVFAQNTQQAINKIFKGKTTVGIIYSFGDNSLNSSMNFVGGPGYYGKGFYGLGARVSMEIMNNLDIVTGVTLTGNKFEVTPPYTGTPVLTRSMNLNVFSIPLFAKFHFLKFLYVSGGPVFNLNGGERDLNGIGAGADFGGEYSFNNGIVLSFGPFIRVIGVLPWKNYKLINSGVNFGIGYRF